MSECRTPGTAATTIGGVDPALDQDLDQSAQVLSRAERAAMRDQDRLSWRPLVLAELPPPQISPLRRAGLITLRA